MSSITHPSSPQTKISSFVGSRPYYDTPLGIVFRAAGRVYLFLPQNGAQYLELDAHTLTMSPPRKYSDSVRHTLSVGR